MFSISGNIDEAFLVQMGKDAERIGRRCIPGELQYVAIEVNVRCEGAVIRLTR